MHAVVTHRRSIALVEKLLHREDEQVGHRASAGERVSRAERVDERAVRRVRRRATAADVFAEHHRVPALVGHFHEQVAMRRIGHRELAEVAQHGLHEHVLEPDAGRAQRRALVAAVGVALRVGHRHPDGRAVEGQLLGREVEGLVVDGQVPIDFGERVERGPLRGGHELAGLDGSVCLHTTTLTLTVNTVKIIFAVFTAIV